MAKRSRKRAAVAVDVVVVNGRALNRSQALLLERAAELAGGSLEHRRQAQVLVRRVEAQLADAAEAAAVEADMARVASVAGAEVVRVERVEVASFVRDAHGAVMRHQSEPVMKVEAVTRMRKVDGLESLLTSGALDRAAYEVGMLYRAAVARAQPSVASSLQERTGVARGSNDAAVVAGLERAIAGLRLRLVRTAVADDKAMAVLDGVAGRGVTVRSLVAGGDARARATGRLVAALRAAEPLLRVSDEKIREALLRSRATKGSH